MLTPLRTTLALGIISGVSISIILGLFPLYWGWISPLKLFVLLNLVVYAQLLCSWSNTGRGRTLYPLAIAASALLWPTSPAGFFLLSIGILGWVRSGICFPAAPIRSFFIEVIGIGGGAGIVMLCTPGSALSIGLACWLFYLLQSLYFFVVVPGSIKPPPAPAERFEQAHREIMRILERNSGNEPAPVQFPDLPV